MKPENILTLEKHRHIHDTLIRAFYVKGLNYIEREDLVRVMREEFNPISNPDLWCGECVADFIKDLYRRFDQYLAANPPKQNIEVIEVSQSETPLLVSRKAVEEKSVTKNHKRR